MTNRLARRPRPLLLALGIATTVAALGLARSARAQETEGATPGEGDARPVDRWLLTTRLDLPADPAGSTSPLETPSGPLFPDRDLVVGPGYWHLVRDDGRRRFDIGRRLEAQAAAHEREGVPETAGPPVGAGSVLAHAYLRAPADRTVRIALDAPACGRPVAWLNGQRLGDAFGDRPSLARLAGGWNTLLVRLDESAGCGLELAAALLPAAGRDGEGRALPGLDGVRAQASRPPGVRRNFPAPRVTVADLRPAKPLVWVAGAAELLVPVTVRLTAWGRGPATEPATARADAEGERRPEEPPAVDLSGEWHLRLFSPIGFEEATARFRQAEDGTLRGELGGERFSGEVREGWVSGERFSFATRFSGGGASTDVRLQGVATGDSLRGTLRFGGIGGFESRFEGVRADADSTAGDENAAAGDPEARPPAGDPEAAAPAGRRPPGRPGRAAGPGFRPGAEDQEADLEALHARIRRQLLPDREPAPPAPARVSLEIELAGERVRDAVAGLRPARPEERAARAPFRKVRETALDASGARVRVLWDDEEARRLLPVEPADLLRALHAPIALKGWTRESEAWRGAWRIPRGLGGFTLTLDAPGPPEARWRANGRLLAADEPLCAPCREGERLELELSGATPLDAVRVVILEAGYPGAADAPDAPSAREWLRALDGDNRRYLELSRRHAATPPPGRARRRR